MPAEVARVMEEPTTLQIPKVKAPFSLAISNAANVSAVSPDCEIAMTISLFAVSYTHLTLPTMFEV